MKKLKLSSRVADHLIQAVLIFASVFLAFWLTEKRDSRIKQELLRVSLEQIASELEANHEQIEIVYGYHDRMVRQIDSLKKFDENWRQYYGYYLEGWDGMLLPMLRSSAYQTFQNSGIASQMELELAKNLADIYNAQSIVTGVDNSVFDIVMTDQNFTSLPTISHISSIYLEVLPQVLDMYQKNGKKWLSKYGYDLEVGADKLKKLLEEE